MTCDNVQRKSPPIYFYIPPRRWPSSLELSEIEPSQFGLGVYCWTFQTYYHLHKSGFPCALTNSLPEAGIIVAYRTSFPNRLRPNPNQYFVCIKGDESWHAYAHLHVVQNVAEVKAARFAMMGERIFMPIWPQPGLIPRDPGRGDRFENVCYFGREEQLAPELRTAAWIASMEQERIRFRIISDPQRWKDYSDVDAVVAVRRFKKSRYTWKPATKLYQAWHAQAPAIVGAESAFQAEQRSPLDFIEAETPEDVRNAILLLRDNRELRQKMVANGMARAAETTVSAIVERWRAILTDTATHGWKEWINTSRLARTVFLWSRTGIRQVLARKFK